MFIFHDHTSATRRKAIRRGGWFFKVPRLVRWSIYAVVVAAYLWGFWYYFISPYGFRWNAVYGDPHYPDGYDIRGIDISHYQGDIDWGKLQYASINGSPVRFVMIKATQGCTNVDKHFFLNFRSARDYGFMRGAYHFWSNLSTPEQQARFYISNVALLEGDLPPILDVETFPEGTSVKKFQEDVLSWLNIVEKQYGVSPILYTNLKFRQLYLSDKRFNRYPYWIAHYYVQKLSYKGPWKFWQHTDAGRLPGIRGDVDLNVYNGSYYDMQRMTVGN